jgi:hypothetical protein
MEKRRARGDQAGEQGHGEVDIDSENCCRGWKDMRSEGIVGNGILVVDEVGGMTYCTWKLGRMHALRMAGNREETTQVTAAYALLCSYKSQILPAFLLGERVGSSSRVVPLATASCHGRRQTTVSSECCLLLDAGC